ncbi:uncharacterized protein EKO05_0010241 [Ascochyta rabiei]|uniref:uncharacterized protein n=1 Tax=Didymella rabiei TaxID=5454 RepID=UPI0021FA655C|nr:uncharacterized protein EKO05_0010241 [Ascochyta rabiei]UPX19994.1 hypothetical protein EKO05_0010241 [Ascochyta rabiei]
MLVHGAGSQRHWRYMKVPRSYCATINATLNASFVNCPRNLYSATLTTQHHTMACTLLGSIDHRLPNELTLAVVQQLDDDNRTLCTLAQTCRGFQQLAEEHIYKTIKLRSVRDLRRITSAFASRHDRVRAVHTLKILYRWNEHLQVSLERRKAFNECVAQMVNLREWHVESPYDNFKWEKGGHEWVEGDMERFRLALEKACVDGAREKERFAQDRYLSRSLQRTVGLAQLESLTIHSHGAHADFWPLDGFHCLFRHPSLRYLHVSCVTFPETLEVLESHKRTTPLTTLIFDECNLEPKSLLHILGTPEKLKHLTLGENVFNINRSVECSPKLSPDPLAALEAIAAVAHSLESLTHLDSKWRLASENHMIARRRLPGDGMRQFHSLKTMECDTGSFLHEAVVMNHDLAPPNLDTLIVRRHFWVVENFFDYLPEVGCYTALPSLNTLELRQSAAALNFLATSEYICEPDRLRNRHAFAYKLFKSDINFRLGIELGRGSSLIPPYLHGEPVPQVRCLYDASRIGFRRHINKEAVLNLDVQVGNLRGRNVLAPPRSLSLEEQLLRSAPSPAAPPTTLTASTSAALPETDQLGDDDVQRITGETRRALDQMKERFARGWHLQRDSDPGDLSDNWDDEIDDFEGTDEETDSDFEAMIQDLQNDGDEEAFLQFIEHMQEQGVEIEMQSDEEGNDDEWHEAEEGVPEDWEDAEDDLEEHEAELH